MKKRDIALRIVFTLIVMSGLVFLNKTDYLKSSTTLATDGAIIPDNILWDVNMIDEFSTWINHQDVPSYLNGKNLTVLWNIRYSNKSYKAGDRFVTTIPEGLEIKEDSSVNFSGEIGYEIEKEARTLTVVFKRAVTSGDFTIRMATRLFYEDETSDMAKTLTFNTPSPKVYNMAVYSSPLRGASESYLMYNKEGKETKKKPVLIKHRVEINRYSKSLASSDYVSFEIAKYLNAGVESEFIIDSLVLKAYPQDMKGEKIGEEQILKINEDYTLKKAHGAGDNRQFYNIFFTSTLRYRLELSYSVTIDYSKYINRAGSAALSTSIRGGANSFDHMSDIDAQFKLDPPNPVEVVSKFGRGYPYPWARFNGNQPINQLLTIINFQGDNKESGEASLLMKGLGLDILDTKVYQGKELDVLPSFERLSEFIDFEIKEDDPNYPIFEGTSENLTISHQKIDAPLFILMTVAKKNYFDISKGTGVSVTSSYGDNNLFKTDLDFLSKFNAKVSLENDGRYTNVGHTKVDIPPMKEATILPNTAIKLLLTNPLFKIYANGISITDAKGKKLENTLDISYNPSNLTMIITTKEAYPDGLYIDIPMIYEKSGEDVLNSASASLSSEIYRDPALVELGNQMIKLDIESGEQLSLKDLEFRVFDQKTNIGLPDAQFTLKDKEGKIINAGPSDVDGKIKISELGVAEYTIIQTKGATGYALNQEFTGGGKDFSMSATEENNLNVPLLKNGSLTIHFSYADGTDLNEPSVQKIHIKGVEDTVIDLTKNEDVKAVMTKMEELTKDFKFLNFENGKVAGEETKLVMPRTEEDVYYHYEGLISMDVSKQLKFEQGYIQPFKQILSYKNDEAFLLNIRDNRQFTPSEEITSGNLRGDIRVQAYLSKEFTTATNSSVLRNARLSYQNKDNIIQLNGNGGEIIQEQQKSETANQKNFEFVLDNSKNENGFKLDVAPGEALANQAYYGEVTWEFIKGP